MSRSRVVCNVYEQCKITQLQTNRETYVRPNKQTKIYDTLHDVQVLH